MESPASPLRARLPRDLSPDELDQLRDELLELMQERTRKNGRFSRRRLQTDGWNYTLSCELLDELVSDGRVVSLGRAGFRWVATEDPAPYRAAPPSALTPVQMRSLRRRFSKWARAETRDHGLFKLDDLRARHWSRPLLVQLRDQLLEEGQIESLGRKGFRWVAAEEAAGAGESAADRFEADRRRAFEALAKQLTREKNKFSCGELCTRHGYAPSVAKKLLEEAQEAGHLVSAKVGPHTLYSWAELTHDISWSRHQKHSDWIPAEIESLHKAILAWARPRYRFTLPELRKEFELGTKLAARMLRRLDERSEVLHVDDASGYVCAGVILPARNLAQVVAAAQAAIDPDARKADGRKTKRPEDLAVLTPSEFSKMQTIANRIAESKGIGALDAVSLHDPMFHWDESAGEWALQQHVNAWYEGSSSLGTMRTAAKNLMLFALHHEFIEPGSEVPPAAYVRAPAPTWLGPMKRLAEVAIEANDGKSESILPCGTKTLALYATRRGELSPETTHWGAVKAAIEDDFDQGRIGYSEFRCARQAYRLLTRVGEIDGPHWATERDDRASLLPMSALWKVVEEEDWSGWSTEDGRPLETLLEGPYGLKAYVTWARAPRWKLERLGLPDRAWVAPTDRQKRQDPEDPFRLADDTLKTRLYHISYLLGLIHQDESDRDLTSIALADLLDAELAEELADFVRENGRHADQYDEEDIPVMAVAVASSLAVLANPFLYAQAIRRGDEDRAAGFDAAAQELRKYRDAAKNRTARLKNIQEIAAAWRGSDHRWGWLKLWTLVDCVCEEIGEAAGGLPIQEQARALCAHRETGAALPFERTYAWARLVRDAVLVNFARLVPVRRKATTGLELGMWTNAGAESDDGLPPEPWQGEILLDFPRRLAKNKKAFRVNYIPARCVGDPLYEQGARRHLLYLYFSPGGAREILLTPADETSADSPYVFPAEVARAGRQDCRWDRTAMSTHFKETVLRHAAALNINVRRLRQLFGGLSFHAVRLLFGTYWANQGEHGLALAAMFLHHGNLQTTIDHYLGICPSTAAREVPRSMIGAEVADSASTRSRAPAQHPMYDDMAEASARRSTLGSSAGGRSGKADALRQQLLEAQARASEAEERAARAETERAQMSKTLAGMQKQLKGLVAAVGAKAS